MITELPSVIRRLLVPSSVIATTQRLLDPFKSQCVEGCVLWYGYVLDDDTCLTTTCVRPLQRSTSGNFVVPAESIRSVRKALRPHGLLMLMGIHTHPRRAFFSEWDEENALNKRKGALNMVVPDFGNVEWIDAKRFCVVEMDERGTWREWSGADWNRIQLLPSQLS